jgi:ribosomal 50S subunit-recycling heat shock protein
MPPLAVPLTDSLKPADPVVPGERLDVYLVRTGLARSRRQARSLIEAGCVRVNGGSSKSNHCRPRLG